MKKIPLSVTQEEMWVLSSDRRTVRLNIPAVPIAGLPKPLNVHLDCDAVAIEEMIERLTALRARMLPASSLN